MARKRNDNLTAYHKGVILDVANELFLANGIAKTTMDDIANKAGYSKTTVYAYFKNKDDLLNHIIYAGMCFFKSNVEELAKQSCGAANFFMALCRLLVEMHDTYPLYFEGVTGKIYLNDECLVKEKVLEDIYTIGEEINDIILARTCKAVDTGEVKPLYKNLDAVLVIWIMLIGIVEKTSLKTEYIVHRIGKSREEFMNDAFKKLLLLILV